MMNAEGYQPLIENVHCDLRIFSLLCALRDKEEIVSEAFRLLLDPGMNEAAWFQVQEIGHEVIPEHPLFDNNQEINHLRFEYANHCAHSILSTTTDRCEGDRQKEQTGTILDCRLEERRTNILPWLGKERRNQGRRFNN